MPKTIIIVGFGPGISTAVAQKFGAEGFRVGLVARNKERLAAGVAALKDARITAAAYPADAGDPAVVRTAIQKARGELGVINAIHWNAYGSSESGDLVTSEPAGVRNVFDVAIVGLLAAAQEALPDLKETRGALLVTNGAFGELSPQMDQLASKMKAMGLALANAAKHKLVGLLAQRLKEEGIFVGEVMVAGLIKGTAWDTGSGIEASKVADAFWRLLVARSDNFARVS